MYESTEHLEKGATSRRFAFFLLFIYLWIRVIFDGRFNTNIGNFTITDIAGISLFIFGFFVGVTGGGYLKKLIFVSLMLSLVFSSLNFFSQIDLIVIQEIVRLSGIFIAYQLAFQIGSSRLKHFFLINLVYLAAISGAVSVILNVLGDPGTFVGGVNRFSGLMYHPNTQAMLCTLALIAEFFTQRTVTFIRFLRIIFIISGLLLSVSLGAILALLITMITILSFDSRGLRFIRGTLIALSIAIFMFVVIRLFSPLRLRVANLLSVLFSDQIQTSNSWDWRVNVWSQFYKEILEKPFWGHGFGSTLTLNAVGPYLPHNEFIRYSYELGLIGVAVIYSFYLYLLFSALKQCKYSNTPFSRFTASGMLFLGLTSLADNTFRYTVPSIIVFFALGLQRSLFRNSRLIQNEMSDKTRNYWNLPHD